MTPQPPDTSLLRALRPLGRRYTARRYGVRLHHVDRVPRGGPVILAGNHLGWLDGPLMVLHTPRVVHTLTKEEMFDGRLAALLRRGGQISVDRFRPDPHAVKLSLRILGEGGVVGIFPEGARGAGEFQLFKGGAAYFALVSGAPVVPVIFFGTREPGQGSHSRPRKGAPPVDLVYGEPWQVDPRPWPRTKQLVAETTASLRTHMIQTLAEAKELTGRALPGPLPADDSERDVARRQATT